MHITRDGTGLRMDGEDFACGMSAEMAEMLVTLAEAKKKTLGVNMLREIYLMDKKDAVSVMQFIVNSMSHTYTTEPDAIEFVQGKMTHAPSE